MLSSEKVIKVGDLVKSSACGFVQIAKGNLFNTHFDIKHQHLYFVSKREIKEGDWFINMDNYSIHKAKLSLGIRGSKIEATTDPSLSQICKTAFDRSFDKIFPQIPQSFVQKYVEKQGAIDEVLIEMTCKYCFDTGCICGGIGYNCDCGGKHDCVKENSLVPKVRKDNTVVVHPIKDLWTKEEVHEVIRSFSSEFQHKFTSEHVKWIEENL